MRAMVQNICEGTGNNCLQKLPRANISYYEEVLFAERIHLESKQSRSIKENPNFFFFKPVIKECFLSSDM